METCLGLDNVPPYTARFEFGENSPHGYEAGRARSASA